MAITDKIDIDPLDLISPERYGQNGIWQLRIAFRHKLAAEADLMCAIKTL